MARRKGDKRRRRIQVDAAKRQFFSGWTAGDNRRYVSLAYRPERLSRRR